MRLIFDPVNDVSRFKGSNTARPRFLSHHDVTDPKVWKVTLLFFLRRLVQWVCTIFVLFPKKQQTKARYDANCVQECLNFNIWGYGLRSKHFEGSRLYRKVMLGRREMKGWGSGLHRKILRALGLQLPLLSWDLVIICIIQYISPLRAMLFFLFSIVVLYPF